MKRSLCRINILLNSQRKGKLYFAFLLSAICFLLTTVDLFARSAQPVRSNKYKTEEIPETVPFKARWGIRTNAVDWLLLTPNLGIEFDLTNSVYNRLTLSLSGKYNWNTHQNYSSSIVYNVWDIRPELRYYWRTERRQFVRPDSMKISFGARLRDEVFTKKRIHPRYWRAYYVGGYVDYNNYSLKFGKKGIQGSAYGIGISAGLGIPLYGYKDRFVDLELGLSAGFQYTEYDTFEHNKEFDRYVVTEHKGGHFVPYPVISDCRVAFVFRFASIKDKYKMVDHRKIAAKQERARVKDSINIAKTKEKELRIAMKDSVKAAKLANDKAEKELKHIADSLETLRKDSLKQAKIQFEQIQDSLEALRKDSLKQAKIKKKESISDSIPNIQESVPVNTEPLIEEDTLSQPIEGNSNKNPEMPLEETPLPMEAPVEETPSVEQTTNPAEKTLPVESPSVEEQPAVQPEPDSVEETAKPVVTEENVIEKTPESNGEEVSNENDNIINNDEA